MPSRTVPCQRFPWVASLASGAGLGLVAALALSGCGLLPRPGPLPGQSEPGGPVLSPAQKEAEAELPDPVRRISPQTPAVRAYRKLGAGHLYQRYASRIHKGSMPPLVYAVAVVETHLDANGNVLQVTFMRAPSHAPEVSLEIVDLIKKASPLPPPGRVGAHTYVETWLWDKSGQFQLDTLTQGQRSR
ncbi:MAG: hypothetical protein JWQ03_2549 [Variovorax sp.]|nr:hypothetical protein [Variovorax sp.]